jgi:hypothetical protein
VLLATSEARPASPLAVGGYAYLERLAAARTAHALPDDIHGVPAGHRSLQKGSQVLERRTERTVLSIHFGHPDPRSDGLPQLTKLVLPH